jgi:hypothetical protein
MSYETPEIFELGIVAEITFGMKRGDFSDGGYRVYAPLVEDQEE